MTKSTAIQIADILRTEAPYKGQHYAVRRAQWESIRNAFAHIIAAQVKDFDLAEWKAYAEPPWTKRLKRKEH